MKEKKILFPLTNKGFLTVLSNSFLQFLKSKTSRSTAKLKPLHGAIATDLHQRLGNAYEIVSQGFAAGKEDKIQGRYFEKVVDIVIKKSGITVAGIAVKFVMQNYLQNSNNYFENMLGETANIRATKCPYFHVFIIFDKLPYYDRSGRLSHWEAFTPHNMEKYAILSKDNTDLFFHAPNKTLIYVVHLPENENLHTREEYLAYYEKLDFEVKPSVYKFGSLGSAVILNDYETFAEKVFHTIKSL